MLECSVKIKKIPGKCITKRKNIVYVCSQCDYMSGRKSNLSSHKRVHRDRSLLSSFSKATEIIVWTQMGLICPSFLPEEAATICQKEMLSAKAILDQDLEPAQKFEEIQKIAGLTKPQDKEMVRDFLDLLHSEDIGLFPSSKVNESQLASLGLFALKQLHAGQRFPVCSGTLVAIEGRAVNWTTKSRIVEEKEHAFVGPLSFVVHNCLGLNAKITTDPTSGKYVLELTEDVSAGKEIFVSKSGENSFCQECVQEFLSDANVVVEAEFCLEAVTAPQFDIGDFLNSIN